MRALFFVVTVLAALYGGYWFVGSSQLETRAEAALDDLRAQGWQVSYDSLDTAGFPSRFDTTVTELFLLSPDGRFAWAAPFFQVLALSYRPNQVIAIWPETQTLSVAGQDIELASQGLRASATVGLSGDLPLDRATLEGGLTAVTSSAGWGLSLDRLLAAVRGTGAPSTYDLFLEAQGLRPASLSGSLGLLRVDAGVTLSAPLDRRLSEPLRLLGLSLREARLSRGDVALGLTGDLAPDAQGFLEGQVTLAADNWRGLLDLLETAGLLVLDQREVVEGALAELAQGSDRIEVPVTFRDGQIEALGLVLLDAPRVL
jgi:hypothetical protein